LSLSPLDELAPVEDAQDLVDAMIQERAPRLIKIPGMWPVLRSVLGPMLGHGKAVKLVESVRGLSGDECFEWGDEFLQLGVDSDGLHHVPESGPALLIANHPGGIADGNAIFKALKGKRDDIIFFANRDALRICPGLESRIIPVEWRKHQLSRARARETLRSAMEAFNQGRCVVIFPAGQMADWSWKQGRLVDFPWMPTGVSIARRFNAPIVPVGVIQRMPMAFYVLSHIHEELRDITIFHGLLSQRGATYKLKFGEALLPKAIPGDEQEATDWLKALCEDMAWGIDSLAVSQTADHSDRPSLGRY
jgi:putative hemolysin